jgi:hypothetical protein
MVLMRISISYGNRLLCSRAPDIPLRLATVYPWTIVCTRYATSVAPREPEEKSCDSLLAQPNGIELSVAALCAAAAAVRG